MLNPTETLLELIEELEENRPSVEGWEMKGRLRGGTWVYEALRDVVESGKGKRGKKGGGRGRGKGKEKIDVVEVVRDLVDWEEREWERVKPRERDLRGETDSDGESGDERRGIEFGVTRIGSGLGEGMCDVGAYKGAKGEA